MHLADVGGYGYREIAGIMGTPTGTVTSRLHRHHRQLRQRRAVLAWLYLRRPAAFPGCDQAGAGHRRR